MPFSKILSKFEEETIYLCLPPYNFDELSWGLQVVSYFYVNLEACVVETVGSTFYKLSIIKITDTYITLHSRSS